MPHVSVRRQISRYASRLRRDQTDVEAMMWQTVRNRQLEGFKFRRQATVGPFVADFLCVEARLIVELDGGRHSDEVDASRTSYLETRGYRVIRFWNNDVVENLVGVLEATRLALIDGTEAKKTLTQPSPANAGGGYRLAN